MMTDRKQLFSILFLAFLFVWAGLKCNPYDSTIEKRIYEYYTTSLVEDGDLNVVNQLPESERWNLTQSLYYPDMHHHSISILWAPIFVIGNLILPIEYGTFKRMALNQIFANMFWAAVLLVGLVRLYRKNNNSLFGWQSTLSLFFSLPLYWYLVHAPSNADVTAAAIWCAILIFYTEKLLINRSMKNYILFGALCGICFMLKPQGIFALALLGHDFFESKAQRIKKFLYPILSVFFATMGVLIHSCFEVIKFGKFSWAYLDIINPDYFMFWENLFAPSGFYYTTPAFLVILLGFLFVFKRDSVGRLCLWLMAIPIVMTWMESYTYVQNENFGARHWIPFIPSFMYVASITQSRLSLGKKNLYYGALALSAIMSAISAVAFYFNYDQFFSSYDHLTTFITRFDDWMSWGKIYYPLSKLIFITIIAISFAIFYIIRKKVERRIVPSFIIIFLISSVAITGREFFQYENIQTKVKNSGMAERAIISDGPEMNFFFENIGTMLKVQHYLKKNNKLEKLKMVKQSLEKYLSRAKEQVVEDPSNYSEIIFNQSKLDEFFEALRRDPPLD